MKIKKYEKGSMLIITLITVLILSFIVASAIRTTTEELYTTYNVYLQKASYYQAVAGIETAAVQIRNSSDPSSIKLDVTVNAPDGTKRRYYTGDIINGVSNVTVFQGFPPPPLPGISLGASTGITPIVWNVNITSELTTGKRKAFSEINAGVYSLMMGY